MSFLSVSRPLKEELEEGEASDDDIISLTAATDTGSCMRPRQTEVSLLRTQSPVEIGGLEPVDPGHSMAAVGPVAAPETASLPNNAAKSVQQKLAALEKLKTMKFGGGATKQLNPFSVSVSVKKELSVKESKDLLQRAHSQTETSDKNFPRKSPTPSRKDRERFTVQSREKSLEKRSSSNRKRREGVSQDRERPRSRNSRDREDGRKRRRASPTHFLGLRRRSPPRRRLNQEEREFRPPMPKEQIRHLDFGMRDLRGQSKESLEEAFRTLLTLESDVIDMWNQRSERLGLDEYGRSSSSPFQPWNPDPSAFDYQESHSSELQSAPPLLSVSKDRREEGSSHDPIKEEPGLPVSSTTEASSQLLVTSPEAAPVTDSTAPSHSASGGQSLTLPWPLSGTLRLPPPRFPPPESLKHLLAGTPEPASGTSRSPHSDTEAHHLRLASFLAKLPRVSAAPAPVSSSSADFQHTQTVQAPSSSTSSHQMFQPVIPRMSGVPVNVPPPGLPAMGLRFGSPPRHLPPPPPGFPGPPMLGPMGLPRVSVAGNLQMFPPPVAAPRRLLELDADSSGFHRRGHLPDPKRPRFGPPIKFRRVHKGRSYRNIPHNRVRQERLSGGRSGDEISEMVAVIPDDIQLRADQKNKEVHVIRTQEGKEESLPSAHEHNGDHPSSLES